MRRELPQTVILSVLNYVESSGPVSGQNLGTLTVGRDSGVIFFKWCPYVEIVELANANSETPYIHQIYLEAPQIQKIIIAPASEQDSVDVVISTLRPPEMHQFRLHKDPIECAAQLMQVLAVNSAISTGEVGPNFWKFAAKSNAAAYEVMIKQFKVYVISCTDGVFDVPDIQIVCDETVPFAEAASKEVEVRFGIDSAQYLRSPLTVDDYKSISGSSVSFTDVALQAARRGLSREMRAIMWPELLGVLPFAKEKSEVMRMRIEQYRSMKQQWLTLSSYQACKVPGLKNAFQTIRMDVRRTNTPSDLEDGPFKAMMVDVLRTYAVYNGDVRYTQGLNDILLPFISVFVANGVEYAEELSFWCFASFLEHAENCLIDSKLGVNGIMVADMPCVIELIEKYDRECGEWLHAHGMEDLNFMISAAMLMYRRSFDEPDLERIWDAIIANKEPRHFFLCFTASLLIFCFPSFKVIDNPCTTRLLPICDQIFVRQNVGSVIGLALHMAQDHPGHERRIPPRIETVYSSEYFTSPFSSDHVSLVKQDLYV